MTPGLNSLTLKTFFKAIADFTFPRVCLVCGRILLPFEQDLCCVCRADLPLTRFSHMSHNPMADRFNERLQEGILEREGTMQGAPAVPEREPYAFATALFHYSPESGYNAITRHLKYQRGLAAGRRFASLLGKELAVSGLFDDVDMVIPVPLHPLRLWKRGYNQAEVIAREVAACLPAARLERRILKRTRRTASQTRLTVEEKAANVRGAFAVACRYKERGALPCRHILLVDDVFTTGSTMAACHAALREVFPPQVRISAATLGFVGEH